MPKRKKKQPFTIPDDVLAKINEVSNHGFMLFTFDDTDSFRPYIQFDNEIPFLALKMHVKRYLKAIEQIENQQMLMSIVQSQQ